MSQIASFTYLKQTDVPFLGFWSKPKPRLFRAPVNQFPQLLQQHALKEHVFDKADGVYVGLVLAWMELEDREFQDDKDPVIRTMQKNLGGSHWILKWEHRRLLPLLATDISSGAWSKVCSLAAPEQPEMFDESQFHLAQSEVHQRLSEIAEGEALLVAVG